MAVILVATSLLYRTLSGYSRNEIAASLSGIPIGRIWLAGLFATASYACLTCFDWLALRYVGQRLSYPKIALTSFCSLSLGHNIGFAALSSGAIRYRFYTRWGVSGGDVAKIILFCGTTVALGLTILGGSVLLLRSDIAAKVTGFSPAAVIGIGVTCFAVAALYLGLSASFRKPLRFRNWRLEMPPFRLALGQIIVGPINFCFVAACLHQALSAAGDLSYFAVAAVYVIANVSALLSHVPGGLGVIETVVLYLIPGGKVIGALVAFRVIYFLIPLVIGGALFGLSEMILRKRRMVRSERRNN
jgi:uncharacterized membrane protein YbhN (UPF0104 family)